MPKRKLMYLIGFILTISLVASLIYVNWNTDTTSTIPGEINPDDNTEPPTDDNTEPPADDTTEPPADDTTEPPTDDNTEPPTDDTTEPPTDNNEPPADDTTEPPADDNTEPPPDDNTDTPPDDNTEPPPDDNTDTPPDDTTEPDDTADNLPPNYFLNLTIADAIGNNEADHEDAEDYIWDSSDATTITLNTDSISVDNEIGTIVDGTTVTITASGTYNISGVLLDGQIIVYTVDGGVVRLVLNGVNISSAANAPVYVENANKVIIVLADNTENYLTDNGGNADDATLLSRDDLTICGNGSLTVTGNDNDAIRSNDGLIIKSGNITVTSVDDGIRGKNYLVIKRGSITVNSVGDGLKSDNAVDERRGYISIEGGTIDITSTEGDAITAQTDLLISGGDFTVTSGGGSAVSPTDGLSTKGLKGVVCIVIDGGDFVISSSDDAVHSDHMILIDNSTFDVSSGDEGLSSFSSIEIDDGTIVITKSNDGIQSGNVTINNSTIQVTSSDDGVSSTDFLTVKDADITVNSVGDGLKSDNNENATKGNLFIDDCTITVTSTSGDAITAQVNLLITNGTFQLISGGGSTVPPNYISTKGLKAGGNITIEDGEFAISASDDAINSNDVIILNNGNYQLATGDDGIHADNSVEINNGTFIISQCYEGIESTNVTINDGHIEITSSDDGINVAGDDGGGMGGFGDAGEFYIFIRGGFIYINSGADGLDSDGYIEMSGGTVIIDGPIPSSFPNGAIDYGNGAFNMTDGLLVAVGMSGMAQGPSPTSTQYSVIINLNVQRPANTLVHLQTTSGETVLTFKPTKAYQSIVFSSPEVAPGSYDLYLGGSSTGTLSFGIYEGGTYTPGIKYITFTISQITTTVGGGGGFFWP
jgi:hypothetical protein